MQIDSFKELVMAIPLNKVSSEEFRDKFIQSGTLDAMTDAENVNLIVAEHTVSGRVGGVERNRNRARSTPLMLNKKNGSAKDLLVYFSGN